MTTAIVVAIKEVKEEVGGRSRETSRVVADTKKIMMTVKAEGNFNL